MRVKSQAVSMSEDTQLTSGSVRQGRAACGARAYLRRRRRGVLRRKVAQVVAACRSGGGAKRGEGVSCAWRQRSARVLARAKRKFWKTFVCRRRAARASSATHSSFIMSSPAAGSSGSAPGAWGGGGAENRAAGGAPDSGAAGGRVAKACALPLRAAFANDTAARGGVDPRETCHACAPAAGVSPPATHGAGPAEAEATLPQPAGAASEGAPGATMGTARDTRVGPGGNPASQGSSGAADGPAMERSGRDPRTRPALGCQSWAPCRRAAVILAPAASPPRERGPVR